MKGGDKSAIERNTTGVRAEEQMIVALNCTARRTERTLIGVATMEKSTSRKIGMNPLKIELNPVGIGQTDASKGIPINMA